MPCKWSEFSVCKIESKVTSFCMEVFNNTARRLFIMAWFTHTNMYTHTICTKRQLYAAQFDDETNLQTILNEMQEINTRYECNAIHIYLHMQHFIIGTHGRFISKETESKWKKNDPKTINNNKSPEYTYTGEEKMCTQELGSNKNKNGAAQIIWVSTRQNCNKGAYARYTYMQYISEILSLWLWLLNRSKYICYKLYLHEQKKNR